jgi:serine/threonine protein kinase
LSESDEILTQIYQECDVGLSILVKSINLSGCVDNYHVERTSENLLNLRHPCIASAIGVVLPSPLREVKIVGMYCGGCSLLEVISASPEWWTPTAKAKAVVSLVLGLRCAHSLGLLHGHLTGKNVVFNEDGMIQITDFCTKSLIDRECRHGTEADVGGFSGESWAPKADVRAFAVILSEIASGTSGGQDRRDPDVPSFISRIIERGQSADSRSTESFADILTILKKNDFQIMAGVDSQKVANFVSWIEWSETLIE